jgi:hypothetical protein
MQLRIDSLLLLLGLFLLSVDCHSFYSRLAVGQQACFAEQTLFRLEPLIVSYNVISSWLPGVTSMLIEIQEDGSRSVIHSDYALDAAHVVSVPTPVAGMYRVCLTLLGRTGEFSSVANQDLRSTARVQVDLQRGFDRLQVELEQPHDLLDQLQDLVHGIKGATLAAGENVNRLLEWHEGELNEATGSCFRRMIFFSVLNAMVVLVISGWQIANMKRFFVEKKLV